MESAGSVAADWEVDHMDVWRGFERNTVVPKKRGTLGPMFACRAFEWDYAVQGRDYLANLCRKLFPVAVNRLPNCCFIV
jgi:hypothetical protein